MLSPMDPAAGFDPSGILNLIDAGHPAVVLREPAWHPNGHGDDDAATLPTRVVGWAVAQDRAKGRVDAMLAADRRSPDYASLLNHLLEWQEDAVRGILTRRGIPSAVLVNKTGSNDEPGETALLGAGFAKTREWEYMSRPLTDADLNVEPTDSASPQLVIRRILTPDDQRASHRVLESAFTDHFNSYPETFEEFNARINTYPNHDWELDFLAELEVDGRREPVGTLLASWQPVSNVAHAEYLGVTSAARGHGVGKALFRAFFREALELGYPKAELFVDADSPTHAQDFYQRFGWTDDFRAYTWHKTITLG